MSALCLVPTPLAAARATRRLCDAQGGVLFGPAVTTLGRLVTSLLAAAGEGRPVLTPLAERLVALDAGDAAGAPLSGLQPDGGLAGALAGALLELRCAEVAPGDARAASASLGGAAARRLGGLADALTAYEARLASLGVLDRAGAARVAAEAVRRGVSSAETRELALLVLDGFVALWPAEWELVAALISRARRTRVHLPYFPDRPDISTPVEPLLRRLEGLHELAVQRDVEVVLPRLEEEGRAPRTAALLAALGGGSSDRAPGEGGRVLAEPGAGEAGEAEAAAEVALRLLDDGIPPGELVVLAPAARRVAPALRRAFAARGVPFATGRGPALAEVPVARLVLEALAGAGQLDRSAATRLARSSWLEPRGVAGLGALLDRAGSLDGRGPPAEALRRRAAALSGGAGQERRALEQAAESIERLEAALRPLARPASARDHAARLSAFIDGAGLRRRAARGPPEVAARDLAALDGVEETAEEVVRASALTGRGSGPLSPGLFRALLGLAAEAAALPPPPEPAAGAVELLGHDEAAGCAVRAAILVGCARGSFPVPPPPEPLLREPERLAVNRHLRRSALGPAAARRAEALHRTFTAAAAGREVVAFVWAAPGPAGDGAPLAPLASEGLVAAGVTLPPTAAPEPELDVARTRRAVLRAAARLGQAGAAALAGTPLAVRAADALARGEVESARRAAVLAGVAGPFAGLVAGTAGDALRAALPAEWTPSQLELYARCPFRAFLRIGARLPDPSAPDLDIDVRDEGSLLHAVLERFVSSLLARRAWPPAGTAEDLREARAAASEVLARFEREGRTGDPAAWAGRREAVLHRLDRLVQAEARDHGGLVPHLLEFAFGGEAPAPPLALRAGGEVVLLRGRIDRVDARADRLLVIDYKNARSGDGHQEALAPESFGETSFQIPAYLMAAARALPGRPRLEATYALLRRAERLPVLELGAGDPILAAEAPDQAAEGSAEQHPRSFAAAVVGLVRRMRAGQFPVVSRGCEHCPYGAVCRFQTIAARRQEEAA